MNNREMLEGLEKNWWLLLLRGIFAILFGILAFAWPGITLITLAILYGVYALADGIFALTAAMTRGTKPAPTWWLTIVGLLGIVAGLVSFFLPGMTALILVLVIGAWTLIHGIFEITGAIMLRKVLPHEWLLIGSGILSVIFGLFVLANPGAGALAVVWLIAIYAILFGALMMSFSIKLKRHHWRFA